MSNPLNDVSELPLRRSIYRSVLGALSSALGPFLGLILIFCVFAAADYLKRGQKADFASMSRVQKILRDSSKVGVAAVGMTMIIIAGGIDLSVGTAMALCATVAAWFFRENYSPTIAILAGILTGCLAGLINGALVSALRVVPFIITLGSMSMFLGAGLLLSRDTPIRAYGKAPDWVLNLQVPYPVPEWLQVPSGVWVMFLSALVMWGLLKYTIFGRRVFALGSNESTARLCGINVARMRIIVYTLAGLFVGMAGLFQFAILNGEGDPKTGLGVELEVIAAVVIGGGSLNGGRGSVWGTLSGACILSTILDGCVTLEIPPSSRHVIVGVIIIAAVTLDQFRQRRLAA